jgi:hypothetical protein
MSTYTKITTVLGLMLIGMSSPGLAAEKSTENTNGLNILISGSPTTHTANSKALQQQATDIIIAKLAADGHRLRVIDTAAKRSKASLHHISLTPSSKSKLNAPHIAINVRARLKIIRKTYTRHATLHLNTVIRNVKRGAILGRLRAPVQSWRISGNCDANCVADRASEKIWNPARQIARTIARKLKNTKLQHQLKFVAKIKLVPLPPKNTNNIALRLVGFDSATIRDIEDHLVVIPGNQNVRRKRSSNSATTFSITRKKKARPLQPLLQKMLTQLGTNAALTREKRQFTLNAQKMGKTGTSSINW